MQSVHKWSLLERYYLAFHPDQPYSHYLLKLRELSADQMARSPGDRLKFQPPPGLIVLAYTQFLRRKDSASARPDRKPGTIRKYAVSAVSSVCIEFNTMHTTDKRVLDTIEEWTDGEESAEAFDPEVALPKLWTAVWVLRGWSKLKRI
eukprot:3746691-Prymnesium_polylepis.1